MLENINYRGDYFQITLSVPAISQEVQQGQFAHLLLPDTEGILLRRPFSIYDADADKGTISIIYKRVGKGTDLLAEQVPGREIDVLGPLGTGFPAPKPGQKVLIVAGGYGCAATYLIAKRFDNDGVCMIGGRSAGDVLLDDRFAATGQDVQISTDDGSAGHQGLVTELLTAELDKLGDNDDAVVYSCGPNPMLKAVSNICVPRGVETYVSLDEHMCCGVGACFTCVVKIKADNDDGWEFIRSCKDGPVFDATTVVWD
ncbi:hypothetical protein BVY04_04920 [bacterium M21]|nr:hypothetical protein BVY04_04920 [bacterium M21]